MEYFSQDYIDFFNELAQNNNKDWFSENKKRYEKNVKEPFANFVQAMIENILEYDYDIVLNAKDCIARINRDIRFSKDKTPYNLHNTAFISSAGKKDKSIPGIYIRISPKEIGIMGGCYGLSKEQLTNLRRHIMENREEFRQLLSHEEFEGKFGEIRGEENKRLPKEFEVFYNEEPLIAKKQFFFATMLSTDLLFGEDIISELMEYWHAMKPLNDFLTAGIKGMQLSEA